MLLANAEPEAAREGAAVASSESAGPRPTCVECGRVLMTDESIAKGLCIEHGGGPKAILGPPSAEVQLRLFEVPDS